MKIYSHFSIYEHYFRYNEEWSFVRGPSVRFVNNERGVIQQYTAHGKIRGWIAYDRIFVIISTVIKVY